jgi:hypothetical protein
MDTEKLEILSRAAVMALQDSNWSFGLNEVYAIYCKLETAISAYDSGEWIESAELFVNIWRHSENFLAGHFTAELSLYNVPASLDEQLSWAEPRAHTIHWLGLCALHDAATTYFQAPSNGYNPGKVKFAPSSYHQLELIEEGEKKVPLAPYGLVTGEGLRINNVTKEAGLPIASLIRVLDPIGQILDSQNTCEGIAHDVSLLCIRVSRLTQSSEANLLSIGLQKIILGRIMSNLPLIIVSTIRGTSWIKRAGVKTLQMAKDGSTGEDKMWRQRLDNALASASDDPLSVMLLKAVF